MGTFAIKKIPKNKMIHRQELEIKVLKMLAHPNIVKFQHSFQDDNNHYIVMEHCQGGPLNLSSVRTNN